MEKWISCKDFMPSEEGIYITYCERSDVVRVKKYGLVEFGHKNIRMKRKAFLKTTQIEDPSVTHWMPLPSPPSK